MCATGHSLEQTLEAGEWRSKAFLNFVGEQQIDEVAPSSFYPLIHSDALAIQVDRQSSILGSYRLII